MMHRQISIKLREEDYQRLEKVAEVMRTNKHAIVVTAVTDTLDMIENRGSEKVPLQIVQARNEIDYAQAAPSLALPKPSVAAPSESAPKTKEKDQQKTEAETGNESVPLAPPQGQRQQGRAQGKPAKRPHGPSSETP
jgi:hypothetical protein